MGVSGAASQLLPLVALPFMTRLYSPAAMGGYAVWLASVSVASIVASGRYELAVVLPESEDEGADLVLVSIAVLLASIVLLVLGLLVAAASTDGWSVVSRDSLVLAPFAILGMGTFQSLSYWQVRHKRFDRLGRARFVQALVATGLALMLGYVMPTSTSLALSWTVGSMVSALLLVPSFLDVLAASRATSKASGHWGNLLKTYRRYPLANVPHALVDGLREAGMLVAFRSFFGVNFTGQLSIATRLTRAPASLAGQAVSQVYFQRAEELKRGSGDLRRDIARGARLIFMIAVAPTILIAVAGPWLVPMVLGSQWQVAGVYTSLMTPAMLSLLVVSPFTFVPHVSGRIAHALGFSLLDLALKAVSLVLGWFMHSAILAVALISAETTIVNVILLGWYLRISDRSVSVR